MCHARCYNILEEKRATYKSSWVRNEKANSTELSWYRILDLIETKSIVNASSCEFTLTVNKLRVVQSPGVCPFCLREMCVRKRVCLCVTSGLDSSRSLASRRRYFLPAGRREIDRSIQPRQAGKRRRKSE